MAKERTKLQSIFVAIVWVAAWIPRVCMFGRMLCNNRNFSCPHCHSVIDHCLPASLSFSITRSDLCWPPNLPPGYPFKSATFPEMELPCTAEGSEPLGMGSTWEKEYHDVRETRGFSPALLLSCSISGEKSHKSALKNWNHLQRKVRVV